MLPIPVATQKWPHTWRKHCEGAHIPHASLPTVTDGIEKQAINTLVNALDNLSLSIGIGTTQGAPIPTQDGHLKDEQRQTLSLSVRYNINHLASKQMVLSTHASEQPRCDLSYTAF